MSDIILASENSEKKEDIFTNLMKFLKLRPRYSYHSTLKVNGEPS